MNRFILKHRFLIAFVILAILAWVVYRLVSGGTDLTIFATAAVVVWGLGTFVFIQLWPRMTYSAYKRAIIQRGLGGDPVPVNTLYAAPHLSSAQASDSSLLGTGTRDVLYVGGWLDLSKGPQVMHVPDFSGRYFSVQFTDPSDGADFGYVGTRTTGTVAGDYLVSGPGWKGAVPDGMKQISSPNNSVLVLGRVLVYSDSDVPTAYDLSKQIHLTALSA